jgi:hypothetical protein
VAAATMRDYEYSMSLHPGGIPARLPQVFLPSADLHHYAKRSARTPLPKRRAIHSTTCVGRICVLSMTALSLALLQTLGYALRTILCY